MTKAETIRSILAFFVLFCKGIFPFISVPCPYIHLLSPLCSPTHRPICSLKVSKLPVLLFVGSLRRHCVSAYSLPDVKYKGFLHVYK